MSSLEKLVRKSEKVNNVYVAGKVFFRLSVAFLFISFGIFIIGSIELRNTELTSTKDIIFITLCVISIFEFLIFMVLAAIIGIYGIFLEAIQSTKSSVIRKKSIKPILGDDMFMFRIVGIIWSITNIGMICLVYSCLDFTDEFGSILAILFSILFVISLIAGLPLSIFLGERLADHFSSI